MKKLLILLVFLIMPCIVLAANKVGKGDCHDYYIPLPDNEPQTLSFDIPQADLVGHLKPIPSGSFVKVNIGLRNPKDVNTARFDMAMTNYYGTDPDAAPNWATKEFGKNTMYNFFEKQAYDYPAHLSLVFSKIAPKGSETPIVEVIICHFHYS